MINQQTKLHLDHIMSLNVEEVLLDKRFGDFNFRDLVGIFDRAQVWAKSLISYDADWESGQYFDPKIISGFFEIAYATARDIESFKPLSQNRAFDPNYRRDEISRKINNSYQNNFREIERGLLYLKLNDQTKKLDGKLSKIGNAKDVSEIKKDLSSYSTELKNELISSYDKIVSEISSLKEAQATKNFSEYFSNHSASYDKPIRKLVRKVRGLRLLNYLIPLIPLISFVYVACDRDGCFKNEVNFLNYLPILVLFSVFMSLVFYHLKSTIRDLNILKNAKESHEHRAKVAETFIAFLSSEKKDEIAKAEMAKQAAIAMFQRVPNGYLTKDQIEPIRHPLAEILLKDK